MTKTETATQFTEGEIKDVVVYPLRKYADERGWLAELFRHDELTEEFHPVMSYISFTHPGIQRGPHEHVDQADVLLRVQPPRLERQVAPVHQVARHVAERVDDRNP